MRIEWELENFKIDSKESFFNEFKPLKDEFEMDISLDF